MDDLDYEEHLQAYNRLFAVGAPGAERNEETSRYAEQQAQQQHALVVFGPLRDWHTKAVLIGQVLTNANARYYMLHGAGRRLGMMFYAYREIIFTARADRNEPLADLEQQTLSRDINVLYLHIRGVLDNFAWCFLYEKHPELADTADRNQVGLFTTKFSKECPAFAAIAPAVKAHEAWNKEMKKRRDPVAHRIPLYIPPSAVTDEEAKIYHELVRSHLESANRQEYEAADSITDKISALGRFSPHFLHHPDDGLIPIYPTIPNDVVHVIRIGNIIEKALINFNHAV